MGAPSLASAFSIGADILKTVVNAATKTILAQTGDVHAEKADSDNVEWWQHVGFLSRPPKPAAKQSAAQGIIIRRGDHDVCIASKDLRGQELAGALADGETCIYAPGEDGAAQGRINLKKTGMVAIYTKRGNTSAGQGMAIIVDPGTDSISILNSTGNGIIIDAGGIKLTAKNAGLSLGSDGNVKLIGKAQTQVDGAGILIGSAAVPGLNSALTGITGVAGKASLKVIVE